MKLRITVFLFIMALAAPHVFAENIKLLYIIPDFYDVNANEAVYEIINDELKNYFDYDIQIRKLEVDNSFFQNIDSTGEVFIEKFMKQYATNSLMYMKILDEQTIVFEIWDANLMIDHIYIKYNERLKNELPDIAANSFLSLLSHFQSSLWQHKLF